jgi:hypothetical protein
MLGPAAAAHSHHHSVHHHAHLQQHAHMHAAHAAMHAANVSASANMSANVSAMANARQQAFRERVEALRHGRLSGADADVDRPFALIQVLYGGVCMNCLAFV